MGGRPVRTQAWWRGGTWRCIDRTSAGGLSAAQPTPAAQRSAVQPTASFLAPTTGQQWLSIAMLDDDTAAVRTDRVNLRLPGRA